VYSHKTQNNLYPPRDHTTNKKKSLTPRTASIRK